MATEKETLQERALQLEIEIEVDGTALTIAELNEAIEKATDAEPEEASPELITLQEEAMQLDLDIYESGVDGEELPMEELQAAVDAKRSELKATHDAEVAEAEKARESAEKARVDAAEAQAKRDEASRAPVTAGVHAVHNLPMPTKKDRALAKKHGYPVAIPGAKVYRTKISFNCAYGGNLRAAGSIVLLTNEHAKNKMEHLKRIT